MAVLLSATYIFSLEDLWLIFNFGLIFSIFKFSALKSFAENFDELQPACVPSFIDDMIDEPINSLLNGFKVFLKSNLYYNHNTYILYIHIL